MCNKTACESEDFMADLLPRLQANVEFALIWIFLDSRSDPIKINKTI